MITRLVPSPISKLVGEVVLVHPSRGMVVRILISTSMPQ
jgi:hypothetical protein